MNLELYQDVILTLDLPESGLCAGDIGTLVERHDILARRSVTAWNFST